MPPPIHEQFISFAPGVTLKGVPVIFQEVINAVSGAWNEQDTPMLLIRGEGPGCLWDLFHEDGYAWDFSLAGLENTHLAVSQVETRLYLASNRFRVIVVPQSLDDYVHIGYSLDNTPHPEGYPHINP